MRLLILLKTFKYFHSVSWILFLNIGLIPFTVPQEVILPNNFHPHQKPVLPTWNKVEVLDSNSRDNTL